MGSSDSSGNKVANDELSLKRAENSATILANFGLNREYIYVTGLGQIDNPDIKNETRKVIFNVMFTNKK